MPEKVLVTGGGGFVASFVIKRILDTTDWDIILLNKSESYHSIIRLAEIGATNNPRVRRVQCDISSGVPIIEDVTYILHIGAESHVDISISEPERHVRSNIIGTYRMLEYARTLPHLKKMVQFSTDEVYGSAKPGEIFTEWSRYNSGNPYAATKASGEQLALAWENTYKVPVVITHSMNIFGERQQPKSVIPLFIKKILDGKPITIHTQLDGHSVSRGFIYGGDVAEATLKALEHGHAREIYNIRGAFEIPIDELAHKIAARCGRDVILKYDNFNATRPGVDQRYAVGGSNLHDQLNWEPSSDTEAQFDRTIQWYLDHAEEWYLG